MSTGNRYDDAGGGRDGRTPSRLDLDTAHAEVTAELRLLAERHARGETAASERARFLRHVEACGVCRELVESEQTLRAAVVDAVHADAPDDAAWSRIEAAIARGDDVANERAPSGDRQPWKSWIDADSDTDSAVEGGASHVFASDGEWFDSGHDGVHTRRLSVDRKARRVTMLVRMDPGSSFPPHRHGGAEECFVVDGDLSVGTELTLGAGDFQRCESGSVHPLQSTEGGCTLLISSSVDDDLID